MAIKAALDVGSNSVKLLVADIQPDGTYKVLLDTSEVTALAKHLTPGGMLAPDNAVRTLEILTMFAGKAREVGAAEVVAAGTSALRDAGDAAQFIQRVRDKLGVQIRVLSGVEEAQLGRAVALRELPPGSPDVVFFDIGGGSSELTVLHAGEVRAEASLQLGARRVTDAAALTQPVEAAARDAAAAFISERLAESAPAVGAGVVPRIAGLGGTASTVVWMLAGRAGEAAGDPHGAEIGLAQLDALLAQIAPLSLQELKAWPHLNAARAPVIYAGISIIAALLRHYGAERFTLLDRGLRYGLLLASVE